MSSNQRNSPIVFRRPARLFFANDPIRGDVEFTRGACHVTTRSNDAENADEGSRQWHFCVRRRPIRRDETVLHPASEFVKRS